MSLKYEWPTYCFIDMMQIMALHDNTLGIRCLDQLEWRFRHLLSIPNVVVDYWMRYNHTDGIVGVLLMLTILCCCSNIWVYYHSDGFIINSEQSCCHCVCWYKRHTHMGRVPTCALPGDAKQIAQIYVLFILFYNGYHLYSDWQFANE